MIFQQQTKLIGGEQELADDGRFYGVTNSGRSSLRWLIQSMELKGKTVLVPDFVCQIVIDVLLEFDIKIHFYAVGDDFDFVLPNSLEDIDVIYIVKYFGHESKSFKLALKMSTRPLIIDDVFGTDVPNIEAPILWGYFNSLRKITAISDFSQIVANVPLVEIDRKSLSVFSSLKYQAKRVKSEFINTCIGEQIEYLAVFEQAENMLNSHEGIFKPEDKSVVLAGQFQRNYIDSQSIRQKNLKIAKECLNSSQYIDICPEFPSFLPLILHQRDKVRRGLMDHGVFLAVHWPETIQSENGLSCKILSLPLDPRYSDRDIKWVCALIKKLEQ
ncbi:pyridoxal phosphate-dependent transferase [Photobacterium phosphoreum]|uniref:pyridoxal phosphate-dependent transferase n=1 Tax=Photobacterium phosphoreum TaxID=659 RepID=UPI0039AF7D3A